MLKKFTRILIPVIILSLLMPFFELNAATATSYRYRLTKMGAGTRQTGQWEYEITNEKYDFSTNESVFALSRIFAITNISTFQFRYEIRGNVNRDMLSPVYRPNKSWWAEIWYWDEFGKLPAGNYSLNAMISVDGAAFKKLEAKTFRVTGSNNYDSTFEYNNNYNSCQNPSYEYQYMQTGKSVRSLGAYAYEMQNQSNTFYSNEEVYAMVNNTHIKGVTTFKIKFELFVNGRLYKTNELNELFPNCQIWAYNYSWTNFGPLTAGEYTIKSSIKFNKGAYSTLSSKNISVVSNYVQPAFYNNPRPNTNNNAQYGYNWTQLSTMGYYDGYYRYTTSNPRTYFGSNEEVQVLTRVSGIYNVNSFKIRHELSRDGNFVSKIESPERYVNYKYMEYNLTQSNFGRLGAGNYDIRVFISTDGGAWQYLDTKSITVTAATNIDANMNYNWTQVGTADDFRLLGIY